MKTLPSHRRSELRAAAHALSPVVIIGDKGLTDEVVAEIDRSLKAHELIKVRAAGGDRDARGAWLEAICERLQAHAVQSIGKVLVIYRENPEEPAPKPSSRPAPRAGDRLAPAREKQRARDEKKRKQRDIVDMIRKGKIAAKAKPDAGGEPAATRTSRPRSRTPSPLPESAPPRRRPRTSR